MGCFYSGILCIQNLSSGFQDNLFMLPVMYLAPIVEMVLFTCKFTFVISAVGVLRGVSYGN